MPVHALGGAAGAGSSESGGAGGAAGQAGGPSSAAGGAAGTTGNRDGGNGQNGIYLKGDPNGYGGGSGGGGGADGALTFAYGGTGGDGGSGEVAGPTRGAGGGGGGGGGNGLDYGPDDLTVSGGAFGGNGGNGGTGAAYASSGQTGDGGGGGGGGDGLVLINSGRTVTVLAGATIIAGSGGSGGNGSPADPGADGGKGGAGGAGGDGVFAYDGNTIVNAGVIQGAAGGGGGTGGGGTGVAGAAGAAGAGIVGSDLSVTNSGTIAGVFDRFGTPLSNALTLTGGVNALTLGAGGTVGRIAGNISVSGSLDIRSGSAAATLSGGMLVFGAPATAVTIESGVTLKDDLSGFVAGDALDFKAVAYSTKLEAVFTTSATGGTLHVVDSTHPTVTVASVTLTGAYTSGVFGLSNDGSNGTRIGFAATPSLGMQPNDVATSSIPGSAALVVVDRYNADYSLYQEDTITKASNGNYTFHFQGGSYFNGKTFQSFDNVTNSAGLLLNQTLYGANGLSYQYTTFNPNGTTYQQAAISRPVAGEILYHYDAGSFFTGKPYSAFDNLATTGGTLLDQILDNNDGSHTFTVPGSNLTLTAQKNDTFNVTGQNDTTRFNATGFKADVFNGYKAGDIFSFSTSIFANYAALQQHLSGTGSAVITDTAGDTLTLANVAKSSVTSSMFAFA